MITESGQSNKFYSIRDRFMRRKIGLLHGYKTFLANKALCESDPCYYYIDDRGNKINDPSFTDLTRRILIRKKL